MTYTLWTNSNREKAGAPILHKPGAASVTRSRRPLVLAVCLASRR